MYMSEEFKRKTCGSLFDEWKKCFDVEVRVAIIINKIVFPRIERCIR